MDDEIKKLQENAGITENNEDGYRTAGFEALAADLKRAMVGGQPVELTASMSQGLVTYKLRAAHTSMTMADPSGTFK